VRNPSVLGDQKKLVTKNIEKTSSDEAYRLSKKYICIFLGLESTSITKKAKKTASIR